MNLATFIVGLIVFLIFAAAVYSEVKKRKNGQGGCSCGCENCAGSSMCHPQKKPEK